MARVSSFIVADLKLALSGLTECEGMKARRMRAHVKDKFVAEGAVRDCFGEEEARATKVSPVFVRGDTSTRSCCSRDNSNACPINQPLRLQTPHSGQNIDESS